MIISKVVPTASAFEASKVLRTPWVLQTTLRTGGTWRKHSWPALKCKLKRLIIVKRQNSFHSRIIMCCLTGLFLHCTYIQKCQSPATRFNWWLLELLANFLLKNLHPTGKKPQLNINYTRWVRSTKVNCVTLRYYFFFIQSIHWRYGETLLHLESIALESIQDFIETIQHYNGQAFDPEKQIHFLTTEIMSELVKTLFLSDYCHFVLSGVYTNSLHFILKLVVNIFKENFHQILADFD